MKKNFVMILVLLFLTVFVSGCINILPILEDDSIAPGKGRLEIYLTDDPGDYEEVNIIISKIEGHIAVDGVENEEDWELLMEWTNGLPVDLTELKDVSILLASLELEPNKYTQLRLFLIGGEEDAWVVLEEPEGSEEPTSIEFLEIPSSVNTGIKLNRPFEIIAGWITKLTIDFDAEKSVIKTGDGKYKLKPVIKVTSEIYLEEDIDTGSVSGTVSYYGGDSGLIGVVGASVSLSGGEYIFVYNTITSEVEDLVGEFKLDNVPVGNCVLNVYAVGFNDYLGSIIVEVGEDTAVNVVLLFEETGVISGSVVDSEDSLPISGATVSVSLSDGEYIFNSSALTEQDGSFSIDELPVGTYTLTASAEGYIDHIEYGIIITEGVTIGDIVLVPVS